MNINKKLPTCCGREMQILLDTGKFLETQCGECGDVIYIKKSEIKKPEIIDD